MVKVRTFFGAGFQMEIEWTLILTLQAKINYSAGGKKRKIPFQLKIVYGFSLRAALYRVTSPFNPNFRRTSFSADSIIFPGESSTLSRNRKSVIVVNSWWKRGRRAPSFANDQSKRKL